MFGAKPTGFGATFGNSGTFGANNTTPFGGSNAFGANKPAATTGFGTPGGFGTGTQPAGGLFGGAGTSSTAGGMFSGTSTPGFGQQQSSGFSFGSTPSTSSSLFGQSSQPSGGTNLFGTPTSTNAFAAKPAGFGGGFGTTTTASTGGLFGTTQSTGGMFGSSAAGFGQTQSGTVIKFNPPAGQDTMVKNGSTQQINTKHQCITAMKEYENKSLEELRMEDYTANRKGKQGGAAAGGSFFGTTPATQASTGFTFGVAPAKPTGFAASTGFGTSTSTAGGGLFGQPAAASSGGGLFGQNKPLFGTATTQAGFGGFNTSTSTGTSSFFNSNQQTKTPFGATAPTTQPSLFGGTQNTFGAAAPNTGFGGFGTTAQPSGGLFAKPFGTATTTASSGFNFGATNPAQGSLFAKPFSNPSFSGFNTATTSAGFGAQAGGLFCASKPNNFSLTTSTAPSTFNFGAAGGLGTQPSLFGNNQAKPGFGNLGTTTGFNTGFGGGTQHLGQLGGNVNTLSTNTGGAVSMSNSAQLQQTLLALTYSPYGDSPLFWNMKEATSKRDDLLKPTNPAAQKAVLASANQHKVSPRPSARIKPKSLHGVLNGSKSQMFEGLEDDNYSFGNDSFVARKSVKKLTIKKVGDESSTHSRTSSVSGEPANLHSFHEEEDDARRPGRSSPAQTQELRHTSPVQTPETENIIRSKGIADNMRDTPNRGSENMDDTIAMLNMRNKTQTLQPAAEQLANVSIMSNEDSVTDNDTMEERPTTPPPPHPAGIVLSRPGYYSMPSLEELAEMVDDNGDCFVEDLTIGREGYGSIFFPGITNVAGMNLDETVFFRRKEVIVYPDDENKPELGDGLNKKAEITLDCVWPRDKATGQQIKNVEQLAALNWQDKIEANTSKIGAKFIDYRPETGSWVFEVKHFSKYGLLDESDDEEVPEQEKKRLRALQQQQLSIQKQKIQQQELLQQQLKQKGGASGDGHLARFIVGTDEESEDSSAVRKEVPMTDDLEEQEMTPDRLSEEEYLEGGEMETKKDQPSSHRLATGAGLDARNVQGSKALFFSEEEQIGLDLGGNMFSKKKELSIQSPLMRQGDRSGPSLFSSSFKSKFMSPVRLSNLPQTETQNENRNLFSPRLITPEPIRPVIQSYQPPVKEHMALASGLTPLDVQRKIVGTRVTRVIPPVEESYQHQKQELLVDAGLFMGRSFRVGWGPGFTLAHPGTPVQQQQQQKVAEERTSGKLLTFPSTKPESTHKSSEWKITMEKLNVAPHLRQEDKCMLNQHREMLEIQLENSESSEDMGGPVFTPAMGVEALHEYAEKTREEIEDIGTHPDAPSLQHLGMVWDLCVALWGNMPEFKELEVDRDSYMCQQGRREALSRWLSTVSAQVIQKEVQKAKYKDQGHLQAILSLLSGRQIGPACKLALQSSDHNLALLLAQAACNNQAREMVDKQLEEWMSLEVEKFVDENRLKIYSLLSGQLVLTSSVSSVNTCHGLDWKRSLALHLWFLCQSQSNLQDAVEVYRKGFERNNEFGPYTCPPLPPYLETETELDEFVTVGEEPQIWDTCFHLLSLYCRKSHQLEKILNPVTSTANQLDCRLSWHLGQVLQALSYHHLSPYHQASIHMNFASHLESLGLWEWAVFVALHIENPASRQDAARTILNRHITLSSDKAESLKEDLLLEKLNVPPQWIHHAKALRASYEGRHQDQAWHLLKAEHWNRSHRILLRHIAPTAIINENYEDLTKFLEELAPHARSSTILDWNIGGKIFLDYINVCQKLVEIKQSEGEPSLYDLDNLLPEVKMLCTKVNSLPCRNSKDRLCQSEMAKKSATLLRTILTLQGEARGEPQPPIRQLAPYISNLPMPEDYSLHELRALTRSFMLEQMA